MHLIWYKGFDKLKYYTNGTLIEIKPNPDDTPNSYDQIIYVKMKNNQVIPIYDPDGICSSNLIGENVSMKLELMDIEISIIDEKIKNIQINDNKKIYPIIVNGAIIEISKLEDGDMLKQKLCVDTNTCYVYIYNELSVNINDYISAKGRIDIADIKNIK